VSAVEKERWKRDKGGRVVYVKVRVFDE